MKYSIPLLVLLAAMDLASTALGLSLGANEANKIWPTFAWMIIAKTVAVTLAVGVLWVLRHWKVALWWARGLNAGMAAVVVWNCGVIVLSILGGTGN